MTGKRSHFDLHSLVYGEIIFFHVILYHWQFVATPLFSTGHFLPFLLCKSYLYRKKCYLYRKKAIYIEKMLILCLLQADIA